MKKAAILGGALAALTLVAGCGSGGSKVGVQVHRPQTLTLEAPDDGDPPVAVFAAAVATRSHDRLRVHHDLASPYTSAVPANELRLAHDLERGKVAVGYVPARAWAAAGIPEFEALLTPFVLSTDQATQAFATGPLADAVLRALPHSVVGLAVVQQEPRRILATKPPTSLAVLHALRIRIIDNPQTAAAFRSVGAVPVQGLDAHRAGLLLQEHRLDGVESNAASILTNGYQTVAHYFSTWSPFPKFETIVVSRSTWDMLTPAEQRALRAGARDAAASATGSEPFNEQQELINLCEAEGRPAQPTRAHLAAIAAAMQHARPRAVTTPAGKELLAQLLRLPGTGIRTIASFVPFECRHPPVQKPFVHRGGATIPAGVYTVTVTHEDWVKGNAINPDNVTTTYLTTIRKDGTWYQTQKPNFPDQGPFSGTYTVHGDQAVFVMKRAGVTGHNSITAPETVNWSYFEGKLTFRNLIVEDSGSRVLYEAHPWRKVR